MECTFMQFLDSDDYLDIVVLLVPSIYDLGL